MRKAWLAALVLLALLAGGIIPGARWHTRRFEPCGLTTVLPLPPGYYNPLADPEILSLSADGRFAAFQAPVERRHEHGVYLLDSPTPFPYPSP